MEQQPKSIEKREKYWKKCIRKKENPDNTEHWEVEFYTQVLYHDENLELTKECVTGYAIHNLKKKAGMTFGGYEVLFTTDLGDVMQDDTYQGMTIIDYLRTKGFPITFEIWW